MASVEKSRYRPDLLQRFQNALDAGKVKIKSHRSRDIERSFEELIEQIEAGSIAADKTKRVRCKKVDVRLRTHAAIVYKTNHPEASEDMCAKQASIPRSTLRQQPDWLEWIPKIERAAATGKMPRLQTALDHRLGRIVPTIEDP